MRKKDIRYLHIMTLYEIYEFKEAKVLFLFYSKMHVDVANPLN